MLRSRGPVSDEEVKMSQLAHAKSFRDLLVYQKSRELSKQVFELSAIFPRDEIYSLTSQIRRSSRSVGAQIAEAWAKRRYEKHFISKLTDADGEQMETQHWLESAVDFGYLSTEQIKDALEKCAEIGRLLGGMIAKSHLFCNLDFPTLREESAVYLFTTDD
jgi:four helix bundle protein